MVASTSGEINSGDVTPDQADLTPLPYDEPLPAYPAHPAYIQSHSVLPTAISRLLSRWSMGMDFKGSGSPSP